MNDFDDLEDLERELGTSLRLALRRAAASITDERRPASLGPTGNGPHASGEEKAMMIDLEPSASAGPAPRRRRGRLIAAAIVSAAALVAFAVVVVSGRDDFQPADTAVSESSEAVEIARSFLDAYGAYDADRAIGYLTNDAVAQMSGSLEQFRLELSFNEAEGYKQLIDDCEQGGESAAGVSVRCPFDFHAIGSDEIGLGPYGDNYWDLIVRDGRIVSAESSLAFMTNGFSTQMWEPFARWVSANYPEDAALMYTDGTHTLAMISDESIRLWRNRTRGYVAWAAYAKGLFGLPAEGATPSTPDSGELVASMWSHTSADTAWDSGRVWVYADGRLIWERCCRDTGGTGWVEQRLTPEGVELVRAEIISTGLFDPDYPPPTSELGLAFPFYGDIQVRNGERLVYVPRRPGQEWTGEFDRLHERLRNLWSWLPASAWEDRTMKPYVPAKYAVCVSSEEMTGPAEPTPLLTLLPAAAVNLLDGAPHWTYEWTIWVGRLDAASVERVGGPPIRSGDAPPHRFGDLTGRNPGRVVPAEFLDHCFDLATEDTLAFSDTVEDAGIELRRQELVSAAFDAADPRSTTVDITFWPYLPHGVPPDIGG